MARALAAVALLVTLFATTSAWGANLVVRVSTNLKPGKDFHSVHASRLVRGGCHEYVDRKSVGARGRDFKNVQVARFTNVKPGYVRVLVRAQDRSGKVVAQRTVNVRMGRHSQTERVTLSRSYHGSTHSDMLLELTTGDDDLRGGNDNVHVIVRFRDNSTRTYKNVNRGKRWADGCRRLVRLNFGKRIRLRDIASIKLQTTSNGGMGGDNWNLDRLRLMSSAGTLFRDKRGRPRLKRFTGSDKIFTWKL